MKGLMQMFEAANRKLRLSVAFLLICLIGLMSFSSVEATNQLLAASKIVLGMCVIFAVVFVSLALYELHLAMQNLRTFYKQIEQLGK